jgi:membrane protease YdiL (CAAX protease family)
MACVLLFLTGAMSWETANANRIPIVLEGNYLGLLLAFSITTGLLFGVIRNRHKAPAEHRERLRLLYSPANAHEYRWAVVGGISAGIAEEIAYRAVLYELLGRWIGCGFAIVICVVLFVLAHLPQGLRGAIGITMIATLFHIVYVLSGSLLAPILIHAIYDVGLFTIFYFDERKMAATASPVEQAAQA